MLKCFEITSGFHVFGFLDPNQDYIHVCMYVFWHYICQGFHIYFKRILFLGMNIGYDGCIFFLSIAGIMLVMAALGVTAKIVNQIRGNHN